MNKQYILFAGVNGAGKTTYYNQHLNLYNNTKRINTDEIVMQIGHWQNAKDQLKAGRIAVERLHHYIIHGISFNQETTLCGHAIFRTIQQAKENGYFITLKYIGIKDAKMAKLRVKQRVLKGGHNIPALIIEKRYNQSLNNLKKVIPYCDEVIIIDNTVNFKKIVTVKEKQGVVLNNKQPMYLKPYIDQIMNDVNEGERE